ncbi:MAG TPA: carbohydrate-binding protein [Pyrinomonadaceae bacterium]|nr:carbohydrate-binding protein [Pyrinomonadaceae bacterium]
MASQTYSNYVAGNVIDNSLGTCWVADGFAPQWVQLDLGQLYTVSKVRLLVLQDPAGATTHQIYGGTTTANLALLGTLSGNTQSGQWLELTFTSSSVRYLRVNTTQSPSWVGWVEIEVYGTGSSSTPFGGTAISIPGTIEVENYDEGGAEVAYHDTTAGSYGQDYDQAGYPVPSFRQPTSVDIYKSVGYNNSHLVLSQAGDWMKYTVNVAQSGSYVLQAKTWYWNAPGGNFHLESDGVDITGSIQIPGGASDWGYINRTVSLTAGQHVLRLVCDSNAADGYTGDIDDIKFIGTADQFVNTAHQSSLARSPQTDEANYWADINRSAYAHGALALTMDELGRTLFESATYAGRNRNDHWYVYDLYKTYLMREPDPSGWAFWEGYVPSIGRASVRRAFAQSAEFGRIISVLTASGSPSANASSLATAQVDLFNQTGNQVRTRDCEWGLPLISLPGRAGLDLGLSLSYSSMVWTRSGPYTYFDEDYGNPSPGFRLGFPSIRGPFFDAALGKTVYLLITPSGRTQLRQLGASNVYESFDSTYLQLTVGATSTLRSPDGTVMTYAAFEDELHCTAIEDRNGNLITVAYNFGDIRYIWDTLNRRIEFKYDSNSNLTSIEQSWAGQSQPHQWVTFGWTLSVSMTPAVSGVIGTYVNEQPPMLKSVNLHDGSSYNFEYNGDGQVREIRRYATPSDTSARMTLTYIYNGATNDCPRITAARVSAENWTGINGLGSFVETQFGLEGGVHTVTSPDGTIYKETYGTGWQRGLVTHTETWGRKDPDHALTVQRQTDTQWDRDNSNDNYPTNARATMHDVYDNSNHSRTVAGYQTFTLPSGTSCSLPNEVSEYAADPANVLRRTHTDYNLTGDYLNEYRRLIGLPRATLLYQGASTLMAKSTYVYDETANLENTTAPSTQHDDYNYGLGFVAGRGNLTKVVRWDVNDSNQTAKTENHFGYDINGSLTFTIDASQHYASLHYGDWFSDNVDHQTFAYVTTATDADGNNSSVQYNFDTGLKMQSVGPPPGNPGQYQNGLKQTYLYDNAARVLRVTTTNNGAYTRYIYGGDYVASYSTVSNVADEAYSIRYFDGAGHDLSAVTARPEGGFNVQLFYRDAMGRVVQQSNPTQTDGSGVPAGDDAYNAQTGQGGWVYTQQTYDWKGRPLLTINPSTTSNPNDVTFKEASYEGCSCSGGQIVVTRDEVSRRQKTIFDALGRVWKTQILFEQPLSEALNGDGTVYSTTVNTYNARDQVTLVRQWAGAENGGGGYQDTTIDYDGYGRVWKKHVPEQQDQSGNPTYTTRAYNNDDTIASVSDGRGVTSTLAYNGRHLLTSITYPQTLPTGVSATGNVSLDYDAAGNRRWMTDGSGRVDYSYDSLSRLQSESRQFNGLSGTFTLAYEYNLANEVRTVTDQHSGIVYTNGFDSTGRITSVSASNSGTPTTFVSNLQYRAWGAVKAASYGNSTNASFGYDNRLRVSSANLNLNSSPRLATSYQYYDSSQTKFAQDQSVSNSIRDRAYGYDFAGRLNEAYSGTEARNFINNISGGTADGPYRQSTGYDAWSNLSASTDRYWARSDTATETYNQSSNRNIKWSYDANGNVISRNEESPYNYPYHPAAWTFDAAGRDVSVSMTRSYTEYFAGGRGMVTDVFANSQSYDGDGEVVRYERDFTENGVVMTDFPAIAYYLRSSVLGGRIISEYNGQGLLNANYAYAGDERVGQFTTNYNHTTLEAFWRFSDPVTGDEATMRSVGPVEWSGTLDPNGIDAGLQDPFPADGGGNATGESEVQFLKPGLLGIEQSGYGCTVDGAQYDCRFLTQEAVVPCPNNDCGPRAVIAEARFSSGRTESQIFLTDPFAADAEGNSGFNFRTPVGDFLLPDGFHATFSGEELQAGVFETMMETYAMSFAGTKRKGKRRPRRPERRPESGGELTLGAGIFRPVQQPITPVFGGLNPLYHWNPSQPPNVWQEPAPPELVPTEPAPVPEGWAVKPHIGPNGFKIGPDQDLKWFREQGSRRAGSRAGLRAIGELGQAIITITTPSIYLIDIMVVCGPCMQTIHRRQPLPPL